jgi:hypothetical protein
VLIFSSHGGMKMAVPSKLIGDDFGLVRAGGTSSPQIQLLQRDNIDRHLGDNFGYPCFRALPIHSDTAMYIVRRDAEVGSAH